ASRPLYWLDLSPGKPCWVQLKTAWLTSASYSATVSLSRGPPSPASPGGWRRSAQRHDATRLEGRTDRYPARSPQPWRTPSPARPKSAAHAVRDARCTNAPAPRPAAAAPLGRDQGR